MNRKKITHYLVVAVLFLGTLWALDDVVQYWNAKTTVGTIEAVERRSGFLNGSTTYATVTWDEDGLDRRVEMSDTSFRRRGRHGVSPYVGMKVNIVYVKSKPHLARFSFVHQSHRFLWLPLLLGWLFAWMEWRGKIPDSWYEPKPRRGQPIPEDKSWRSETWLKWHGKNSRSGNKK